MDSEEIIRTIVGTLLITMAIIFAVYYYPLLLSIANSKMERLGAWVLLFVVECVLGSWAIRFGPQVKKERKK